MDRNKFRIWDTLSRSFVSGTLWRLNLDGMIFLDGIEWNDGITQFHTGCKDKNGNGIYEGDIIKLSTGGVAFVSYNSVWLAFVLVNQYANCDCERMGNYCPEIQFEVIGNIYEDAELLK